MTLFTLNFKLITLLKKKKDKEKKKRQDNHDSILHGILAIVFSQLVSMFCSDILSLFENHVFIYACSASPCKYHTSPQYHEFVEMLNI